MTADREALETARQLTGALTAMRDELKVAKQRQDQLDKLVRRLKHIIIALAISFVLDLTLTGFFAVLAVQTHAATSEAESASSSNRALCLASNVSRQETIGVWTHLLDDLGPPKTPAARTFETSFIAYLHRIYAPRDCAKLGQHQ